MFSSGTWKAPSHGGIVLAGEGRCQRRRPQGFPWNVGPRSYICDMAITVELHPDAPFSLGAAAAFGFGPHTGRPKPDASEMRLGFVTDDLRHHAGVHLVQRPGGTVTAAIDSAAAPDAVLSQVRRI